MPFSAAGRIYQWGVRGIIRTIAAITILFGLSLLLGGGQRFNSVPAFVVAAAVPGSYHFWGFLAIGLGAWTLGLSLRWHRRCVLAGMLAQTVFFTFFTVGLAVSAGQQSTSPLTGIPIYGGYSVICAICYVIGHELRKVPVF